jgi:hypothetical protein
MNQMGAMDDERAAYITRNIDLAFRMIREIFDDPSILEGLPARATVFVAPPDDPDYANHQVERAQRFAAEGSRAMVWRLGAKDGESRAIPLFDTTRDPEAPSASDAA